MPPQSNPVDMPIAVAALTLLTMACAYCQDIDTSPPTRNDADRAAVAPPREIIDSLDAFTKSPTLPKPVPVVNHSFFDFPTKSRRTITSPTTSDSLPIDQLGRIQLDWRTLGGTRIAEGNYPRFPEALRRAEGKRVAVHGMMMPIDGSVVMGDMFLVVEFRADCLNCQVTEPTGIVFVELADGRQTNTLVGRVTVQGKLLLNADDPEDFLYILSEAEIIGRE